MTVKADSKGRLTGATPGANYTRVTLSGGTVIYSPIDPVSLEGSKNPSVQEITDVSYEDAVKFFGVPISAISAEPMEVYFGIQSEDHLANGFVFQKFTLDEEGNRVVEDGVRKKTSVLIRVEKEK